LLHILNEKRKRILQADLLWNWKSFKWILFGLIWS